MEFESLNHNRYFFHNPTGQIFQYSDDADLQKKKAFYDSLALTPKDPEPISAEDIRHYLYDEGNGCRQLILEVTEACNLRCKYCIYSDHYAHTRSHGTVSMSFETMRDAIDYYHDEYLKIEQINPMKKPLIGFYGGEPLVGFRTIKKAVQYIEDTYPDWNPIYNLTTNGMLFTDEAQDFLHDHAFSILVSLDSYRENHDRNRVTTGGEPTFDKILEHLKRYHRLYGSEGLSISCCYDYGTDFIRLAEFFNEFPFAVVSLTQVQASRSDYYDQYLPEDESRFWNGYAEVKKRFFDSVKEHRINRDSFEYHYFSAIYSTLAYHRMILEESPRIRPWTGTCIPGEKLYVATNGDIKICEKAGHLAVIGDIWKGLDCGAVADVLEKYRKATSSKCAACPVSRLCQLCFKDVQSEEGSGFRMDQCGVHRNALKRALSEYMTLLEYSPELFDDMTADYYLRMDQTGEMI